MSAPAPRHASADPHRPRPGLSEPRWVRWTLIGVTLAFLSSFLLLPVAVVFHSAFKQGVKVYLAALVDPVAVSAIVLTLIAAGVSVVGNTVFGIAAAWLVTRFRFYGKTFLISLIDLPFAVSPVISGLVFVLVFGAQGWAKGQPVTFLWPIISWSLLSIAGVLLLAALGSWWSAKRIPRWTWWAWITGLTLLALGGDVLVRAFLDAGKELPVIFATPGIVLATMFVTFPFVARELIPVMQSVGQEEEQAALSLGANGWTVFWRITIPNVKWGLLYGIVLCNARAMGEFGAVSVVSGHIRGQTNTMPLHIEILFNEYQFAAAFAVSSVLALLAVITLAVKTVIEHRLQPVEPEL